jgi:hypothetical protein
MSDHYQLSRSAREKTFFSLILKTLFKQKLFFSQNTVGLSFFVVGGKIFVCG